MRSYIFKLYKDTVGIYVPLINEEHSIFCMDFNPVDTKYSLELIDSSFSREIKYLSIFKNKNWCPEVIDIDYQKKKIYFKFGIDCETFLPEDFEEQLELIVRELKEAKVYKPSFYPKYFFIDKNNIMKAFNFYTAFDEDEQPLSVEFYRPILNNDRESLINKISENNGLLDIKKLMYHAFNNYIIWPNDSLKRIYKKIYE